MRTITDTDDLADFCSAAKDNPYVTIDTEFLRERTYWSQLCLIQMALPGKDGETVLVDPIRGEDLSLEPLYDLFRHRQTVKVFHAARQDLEIFYVQGQVFPEPLFDTQVAAMVCGYGEQASYETLVRRIAKARIDKSSRFTDWQRRPLSEAQMTYAAADVIHLRRVYEVLSAQLVENGRSGWIEEELNVLTDPGTYIVEPDEAWRRVKTRSSSGRFLAILRELARFREIQAQERNIPRNRVLKDDALCELASTHPTTEEEIGRSRLLFREGRKPEMTEGLLAAIRQGLEVAPDSFPRLHVRDDAPHNGHGALNELLRVLLKAKSEILGIAPRLVASAADLDALADGARDIPLLHGWRKEAFGDDALRLCNGEIALTAEGDKLRVIPL